VLSAWVGRCCQAVSSMSPTARANVWRYATGRTIPPPKCEGGCGALEPKFNLVDRLFDRAWFASSLSLSPLA